MRSPAAKPRQRKSSLPKLIELALDHDNNRMSDLWERLHLKSWNQQYGTNEQLLPTQEMKDPDGTTEVLGFIPPTGPELALGAHPLRNEHAAEGDVFDRREEYRGFILDGGGFDWDGQNGHGGGHARLSPVYKELLVEVDAMEGTQHMPDRAGIAAWMDVVSKGTSQRVNGAGFRTFYVLDQLATPHTTFPRAEHETDEDQGSAVVSYILNHVHPDLSDFRHLHLVDDFENRDVPTAGITFPAGGSTFAVDRGEAFSWTYNPQIPFDTYAPPYISHELHHAIIDQPGDDGGEHFNDTNGNGTPMEPDDKTRVLWNYNEDRAGNDHRQIKYGLGTTQFIDFFGTA